MFPNQYIIDGDIAKIIITNKKGKKITVLVDTEDLERVKKYNWTAGWREDKQRYYIQVTCYYYDEEGNYKHRTILLHKYIMEAHGMYKQVDHKNGDSLNNTKENLRVVKPYNNSANRKGANSNSGTGVRNVNFSSDPNILWVQFMKKGRKFQWEFPISKFKEACEFAEKKRKEIFGEFAGKGIINST